MNNKYPSIIIEKSVTLLIISRLLINYTFSQYFSYKSFQKINKIIICFKKEKQLTWFSYNMVVYEPSWVLFTNDRNKQSYVCQCITFFIDLVCIVWDLRFNLYFCSVGWNESRPFSSFWLSFLWIWWFLHVYGLSDCGMEVLSGLVA